MGKGGWFGPWHAVFSLGLFPFILLVMLAFLLFMTVLRWVGL